MHELSLVQSLLRQVGDLARAQGAARVLAVRMSVGEFSGVEPELMQMAYDDLVKDTLLSGAELVMERVPLEARCEICGREFVVEAFRFECPACHSPNTVIMRGDGLILESVTMEGCNP
jgi:hydrogenase nickel incorporation protein HypA/HybF